MIELSKDKIIERFRSYVTLDTASDDKSETSPSTAKQLELAKLLKSELSGLGLEDLQNMVMYWLHCRPIQMKNCLLSG